MGREPSEKLTLFCKNIKMQKSSLCYTLNAHYEYGVEEKAKEGYGRNFLRSHLNGTNLVVFVVNSKESFAVLKSLCKDAVVNSRKSLVVFNLVQESSVDSAAINLL